MILGVLGVEVGTLNRSKIDQNLKPKTGCRFLVDFGGFRGASWEVKSSQDRSKLDPRKHQKNDETKK